MLKIIAAVARNGIIGKDGTLPWNLPDDLKWFKLVTNYNPVIMGRKTFDSLPSRFRPLPGRKNIVLTHRDIELKNDYKGVTFIKSLSSIIPRSESENFFVIGGSELYRMSLPLAGMMYITNVHADFEGDTSFPSWNKSDWELEFTEFHQRNENHKYPFTWEVWSRKSKL